MFKVDFFTEDKHVALVLRALAGVAKDLKVVPVVNAEIKNGTVKPGSGANMVDLFRKDVGRLEKIAPGDIKAWLKAKGRSPDSASYLAKQGVTAGFLRKRGKSSGTYYEVVK